LNQPLGRFLSDSPASWRDIPFWRLLNHTSGITDIVDKPDFQRIDSNPALGNADVYGVLKRYPLDYQPGQYSRYRQSGYALAELIVTRELQITWAELVSERVLKPAGATNTFSASLAERSAPLLTAAGGYQTTAEDMGRIFTALSRGVIVPPAFLKDLMYSEQYNHSGYSLGNVLQTIGNVKTLGHEGGASRATIRYAPDNRVGVAVFTDQSDNRELTLAIADMLLRELVLGEKTREPIALPLFSMLSGPAGDAVKLYRQEKSRRRQRYDFSATERTLHRLGYVYLKAKRPRDAVSVFELNVEENPRSANAHDSLGEAYFETADYDRALVSYEKSLALDPGNYNAMAMIARIRAQAK
jgi:D-alanyl-D-alanine carboxypeptidase